MHDRSSQNGSERPRGTSREGGRTGGREGERISRVGVLVLAVLWLGLLLGVSFLATPAKFLAPSLSLPVALDVGRQTFAVFNGAEWLLIALLLVLLAVGTRTPTAVGGFIVAAAVTVAQALWMLPALDARVGVIIAGGQPPPSSLHEIYLVAEVIKLLALIALSWSMARLLAADGRSDVSPGADDAAGAASHHASPPVQPPAAANQLADHFADPLVEPLADRVPIPIDRN